MAFMRRIDVPPRTDVHLCSSPDPTAGGNTAEERWKMWCITGLNAIPFDERPPMNPSAFARTPR